MITFLICLALLVTAYFTYGRYLERVARADSGAETPCRRLYDGVDYVPLPRWRVFLIQLLNIAGTGPIFGAILGACFGPVAFLWITFGGIFMGAMHDYLSGMMLVRNDGLSIPEVVGRYLGGGMRQFMRLFSVLLLVLVGAVFVLSPAQLLNSLTENENSAFLASADAQNGVLGKLFSFNVMMRSRAALYTTAKAPKAWSTSGAATDLAAALAWHDQSVCRALGQVKAFEQEKAPDYYGDLYSFLVRAGGRIMRSDNAGVMALVGAATE